jgi:hypothetical protein
MGLVLIRGRAPSLLITLTTLVAAAKHASQVSHPSLSLLLDLVERTVRRVLGLLLVLLAARHLVGELVDRVVDLVFSLLAHPAQLVIPRLIGASAAALLRRVKLLAALIARGLLSGRTRLAVALRGILHAARLVVLIALCWIATTVLLALLLIVLLTLLTIPLILLVKLLTLLTLLVKLLALLLAVLVPAGATLPKLILVRHVVLLLCARPALPRRQPTCNAAEQFGRLMGRTAELHKLCPMFVYG